MSDRGYVLQVRDLEKRFSVRREQQATLKRALLRLLRPYPHEPFWALRGVDLNVSGGEMVGLVGVNGSGKSTLLRVIAGIYRATAGNIEINGQVGGLFELETGFSLELSGIDNIFLSGALMGYGRDEISVVLADVAEMSELGEFLEVPVKTYSSGMKFRLGFGIAMAFRPELLLVDEVLAAADEAFQRTAYRRLREFQANGSAVIMVSHELDAVAAHCDRVVWLANGLVTMDGPTDTVLEAYLASVDASDHGD